VANACAQWTRRASPFSAAHADSTKFQENILEWCCKRGTLSSIFQYPDPSIIMLWIKDFTLQKVILQIEIWFWDLSLLLLLFDQLLLCLKPSTFFFCRSFWIWSLKVNEPQQPLWSSIDAWPHPEFKIAYIDWRTLPSRRVSISLIIQLILIILHILYGVSDDCLLQFGSILNFAKILLLTYVDKILHSLWIKIVLSEIWSCFDLTKTSNLFPDLDIKLKN